MNAMLVKRMFVMTTGTAVGANAIVPRSRVSRQLSLNSSNVQISIPQEYTFVFVSCSVPYDSNT